MTTPCPLCRARYTGHETCQERFERCLAMEFENPAVFGAVHHLTVPSYCLQHNLYSREGWLQSRQLLVLFVKQGLSPQQVRRQQNMAFSHPNREWSVLHGAKLAEFERIVWKRTIADVRLEDPLQYCQNIRTWAKSVLEDTNLSKATDSDKAALSRLSFRPESCRVFATGRREKSLRNLPNHCA